MNINNNNELIINFQIMAIAASNYKVARAELSQHPTLLIGRATVNLVRVLSIGCAVHGAAVQPEAVSVLCGLLKTIVGAGHAQWQGRWYFSSHFYEFYCYF